MKACKKCGSDAINHHSHGRDGSDGDLCDVCYWRSRAVEPVQPVVIDALTDTDITSIAYDCNALPEVVTDATLAIFARVIEARFRGIAQPVPPTAVSDAVLKLSELMRGLEMHPTTATLEPGQLYLIGEAICTQAKLSQPVQPPQNHVWSVSNKTTGMLFWSEDTARKAVASLSVMLGMSVTRLDLLDVPAQPTPKVQV